MTTLFSQDTFTDTSGVLLENHTGQIGAVWTKNAAFGTGSAAITAGGRVRGNAANGVYYSSGVPASADYDVEADLYVASAQHGAGLLGRCSTTQATYYLFDYESGGAFHLYVVVNGTVEYSNSFTMALTTGQTYHLRLSMRGSQIGCWVNGTQVMSVNDSNISAAGQAGVFFSDADTDSTGYQLGAFTGALPLSVPITDPNLFFSPYNWYSDGTGSLAATNVKASSSYAQTNTPGAYLKLGLNAASSGMATLLLDTTPLSPISAADCPMLAISTDGQAFTTPLLSYAAGVTRFLLSGDLPAGSHTVAIYFRSVTLNASLAMGDRWNSPASVVKVLGLELDGKGSATAAPALAEKRMIVFGDSITEAADAVGSSNANDDQDATQSYALLLGAGLGAEVGVIGFSGQGWTVSGYGNVPALYNASSPSASAYSHYFSGQSREVSGAFAPAPDYVVVMHGTNDAAQGASDAAVTTAVTGWIPAARAAAPDAQIAIIIPFGGAKRAAVTAGAAAVSDSNLTLLDLGPHFQATMVSGGLDTNDALHPNVRGHAAAASLLLSQLAPQSSSDPSSGSIVLTEGSFEI